MRRRQSALLRRHRCDARRHHVAHERIGDLGHGMCLFQVLFYHQREVIFGRRHNLGAALLMSALKSVHFCTRYVSIGRRLT